MKKVFDIKSMQFMTIFEKITRVTPKDCIIQDNQIIFIVDMKDVGTAVGQRGANAKKLEQKLKKKIKIAGYSEDVKEFIKSLVAPLQLESVEQTDGIIEMTAKDLKSRGLLIGRNASILRAYEEIVKRFFPIDELKVK
ncbi:MAG TPA: NusA-like transcription termination signal-binding factor [Candidatus Woesearchaeota archaeon]|nr:NusA-like transcription termination signal-binding factor [Candidatus Woesearchaeota archaeon]